MVVLWAHYLNGAKGLRCLHCSNQQYSAADVKRHPKKYSTLPTWFSTGCLLRRTAEHNAVNAPVIFNRCKILFICFEHYMKRRFPEFGIAVFTSVTHKYAE
jgi:hypothetical protein